MKWTDIDSVDPELALLYWALIWTLRPIDPGPIDVQLQKALSVGGGGDPGWEIEPKESDTGSSYRIWGDPEMSGLSYAEREYTAEQVKQAAIESLKAFSKEYPNLADQAQYAIEMVMARR